jgi:hypothetical protein
MRLLLTEYRRPPFTQQLIIENYLFVDDELLSLGLDVGCVRTCGGSTRKIVHKLTIALVVK